MLSSSDGNTYLGVEIKYNRETQTSSSSFGTALQESQIQKKLVNVVGLSQAAEILATRYQH
jgi:hypothetical protein